MVILLMPILIGMTILINPVSNGNLIDNGEETMD